MLDKFEVKNMNKYIGFAIYCLLAICLWTCPFPENTLPYITGILIVSTIFAFGGLFTKG